MDLIRRLHMGEVRYGQEAVEVEVVNMDICPRLRSKVDIR